MARNDGLSTANFLGGAMQGYNFMQGVENNKLRKEEMQHQRGLRDADEARRAELHRVNMQDAEENRLYRKSDEARRAESHGANMQDIESNRIFRKSEETRRTESHKASMQSNQQQQEFNKLRSDQITGDIELQLHRARAAKMHALNSSGLDPNDENLKIFDQVSRRADPEYILSDEMGSALNAVDRLMAGEISRDDDDFLKAFDIIVDEVPRGATEGRKVRTNRLLPSKNPGKIYVGLESTSANGDVDPGATLTNARSSDPKDLVSELDVNKLIEVAHAVKRERALLQDPRYIQAYIKMYGPQDAKAAGSGGKMPSKAQLHQYIMQQFPDVSKEDAWSMANSSPENQSSWTLKLAGIIAENENIPVNEALEKATSQWQQMYGAPGGRLTQSSSQSESNKNGQADNKSAPAVAIEALKKNPDLKDQFLAKYGYLPQ